MDDELAVRLIRETLPDLVAIYRFGSSATGGFRAESDVDLACLGRKPLDPVERFELQVPLADALRRDSSAWTLSSSRDSNPYREKLRAVFEGRENGNVC